MENNEKSIGTQIKEGYERGVKLAGGKEDASQARVLKSSEPLPDEVQKLKKLYVICAVLCLIGTVVPTLLILGIFGFFFSYLIVYYYTDHKRKQLRIKKFKFLHGVDDAMLFEAVQPVLISKYGMQVEKRKDGVLMITHDKLIYDVLIQEDDTFCIWWRMTWGKAFFAPGTKSKGYRKSLAAMGIIAYEIQKAFAVTETVDAIEEV